MRGELGALDLAVWREVARWVAEEGCAPTLAELAVGCFCSKSVALMCLTRLEARGYLVRTERRARGIRLLHQPPGAG